MKHFLVILAGILALVGFTLLGFFQMTVGIYLLVAGLVLAGIVHFNFFK